MGEIIDIHVHFGAPKNNKNECFWSKKFEQQPAYWFMKITSGSLFKKLTYDSVYSQLMKAISKAEDVDKVVLLAMDRVYNEDGEPCNEETHLYVPNSFVIDLAKNNEKILTGASVHPYRTDWQKELEYCWKAGAKLIKWIPSSQQIDPANNKCIPFYEKLIEYELPLLVHSGPEYAIPTSNGEYEKKNNPKYLRKALDMGVKIIIAHCALPFWGEADKDYLDDMDDFFKLFEELKNKNWKLYADMSALTTPLRSQYIPKVKEKIPHDRLLFGSDYPIPASELSYKGTKNIIYWLKLFYSALKEKNPLDKNYKLIKQMKFNDEVFTNPYKLFSEIKSF